MDSSGALRSPRRAVQYLISNVISRREIFDKQGSSLGSPEGLELPLALGTVPPATGVRGASVLESDVALAGAAS